MKKMRMITTICFLVLGANSFASQSSNNDIITSKGHGYECRGFCSGMQKINERNAIKQAGLNAITECQSKGYEVAILISEHKCNSYALSEQETATTCVGSYQCEE